jgi:cytochrome c oxidase cbb3-type subunit 2
MKSGPIIFLAAFFALATSWLGFVIAPQVQIGREQDVQLADSGQYYPPRPAGEAAQGAGVYRANGCFYCHTEQVRPRGFGADVARGWGGRVSKVQSVAEDYLWDRPVMLGSQRVGPDLANIGLRQTNAVWLYAHLYDPQSTSKGSSMPPYRYLFRRVTLMPGQAPSVDAVPVDSGSPDTEIVPTDEARELVAYLLSLRSDGILYDTPPLNQKTNAPAATGGTNAPATAVTTNALQAAPTK